MGGTHMLKVRGQVLGVSPPTATCFLEVELRLSALHRKLFNLLSPLTGPVVSFLWCWEANEGQHSAI